ncbi:hypothetical protein [Amorphus orientalis]|uniref:Uncharacterized protein n=1 Tax=Amorphus orientalis TaxID=649198 RepID=A0AAE3VUC7_9HYPH|nr:hypothetical protein [Amorphus orientalis]MDQ0317766.1 hypothetical protein [Amorphus orientalis]
MSQGYFIPDLEPGEPSDGPRNPGEPWHPGLMVTRKRAARVAAKLFPTDMADGTDCRAEEGREGEPCRICEHNNEQWAQRVRQVRRAMLTAFS